MGKHFGSKRQKKGTTYAVGTERIVITEKDRQDAKDEIEAIAKKKDDRRMRTSRFGTGLGREDFGGEQVTSEEMQGNPQGADRTLSRGIFGSAEVKDKKPTSRPLSRGIFASNKAEPWKPRTTSAAAELTRDDLFGQATNDGVSRTQQAGGEKNPFSGGRDSIFGTAR